MGYVGDWNRQSFKKGASLEKPVVRKFAEGGPVTQDTREAVSGASYDSISDFMNYVRGRGKYDARAMDNPFTESSPVVAEAARAEPDPAPAPAAAEPVNQAGPEDGNVGGPRQESPAKASAPVARRQFRRVPPPSSSAPARVAANPVKPVPVAPAASSPEPSRPVGGPMAPSPMEAARSAAMAVPAASPYGKAVNDRIRESRSDKPFVARVLDRLASKRQEPVAVYKDGGLVGDSNWSRGNFKKSGC